MARAVVTWMPQVAERRVPVTLEFDHRQPVRQTIGSVEPSPRWNLGPAADDGGPLAEPALRKNSYLSECECPDDCLRDHENE